MKDKLVIVTHDGTFHPDDIFAVATLRLALKSDIEIRRTRNPEIISSADYVVDVGGVFDADKNFFDHHMRGGAGARSNGVPYASFGLVWKKFGGKICSDSSISDRVDGILVQPIDAGDNGVGLVEGYSLGVLPYDINRIVDIFNSTWREKPGTSDDVFGKLVEIAEMIISREVVSATDFISGRLAVVKAYETSVDKRMVILDEKYDWREVLVVYPEPIFVVVPAGVDGWSVRGVPKNLGGFDCRKLLPSDWAGKRGEDFVKITAVSDAVFCHSARFVAFSKTKDGAVRLAEMAIKG